MQLQTTEAKDENDCVYAATDINKSKSPSDNKYYLSARTEYVPKVRSLRLEKAKDSKETFWASKVANDYLANNKSESDAVVKCSMEEQFYSPDTSVCLSPLPPEEDSIDMCASQTNSAILEHDERLKIFQKLQEISPNKMTSAEKSPTMPACTQTDSPGYFNNISDIQQNKQSEERKYIPVSELLEGQKQLWASISLAESSPILNRGIRRSTVVGEVVVSSPSKPFQQSFRKASSSIYALSSPSSSKSSSATPSSSSSLSTFLSIEELEEQLQDDNQVERESRIKEKNGRTKMSHRKTFQDRALLLRKKYSVSIPAVETRDNHSAASTTSRFFSRTGSHKIKSKMIFIMLHFSNSVKILFTNNNICRLSYAKPQTSASN